ncbi:hypothetical protein ACHWQZ_G000447 [Mnemiopsis leidyi]
MSQETKTNEQNFPPTCSVQVTEHCTPNDQPEGSNEDNSSFQVSISSHYSTPFDCILLAQAQELRSDVDNIKLNICSQLKVDSGKFATVTPTAIKNCNTLNKITLATGLLALLNMSEKVCSTISGCRLPEADTEHKENLDIPTSMSQLPTVEASLQAIHASLLKHKDKDSKTVERMFKSIEEQLEDLRVSISQLRKPRKSDASTPDFLPVPVPQFQLQLDNFNPPHRVDTSGLISEPTPCTSSYLNEFIDDSMSEELKEFLDSHSADFDRNTERGHSVFLHPILCKFSVKKKMCTNAECTYIHLKGTRRKEGENYQSQKKAGDRPGTVKNKARTDPPNSTGSTNDSNHFLELKRLVDTMQTSFLREIAEIRSSLSLTVHSLPRPQYPLQTGPMCPQYQNMYPPLFHPVQLSQNVPNIHPASS